MRSLAMLLVVCALAACGSKDAAPGASFDLEAQGTGPANADALLPLALGYRVERQTRVMAVTERSVRFGEAAWVLAETLPTVETNAPDRMPTSWFLAEREDGLYLLALDGDPLPRPARLVPRELRAGDAWVFRDGDGKLFGAARALGGDVRATLFGPRRVFTIAFSFERPRFVVGAWTLAEGRGFVDDVQAVVFPLDAAVPAADVAARLPLEPIGPTLTGAQAVSLSAVAGAGPGGELAVRVGLLSGAPTPHSASYACLLAGPGGATLQESVPGPDGETANVFPLVPGNETACGEAAVTRPASASGGFPRVVVDVQGRRLIRLLRECNSYDWECYAITHGYLGLFARGAEAVGLAVNLGSRREAITSLNEPVESAFDPTLALQDPTEFSDSSAVTWRDGLGFASVTPERGIVRSDVDPVTGAAADVLFLRRGRASTARLAPLVGAGVPRETSGVIAGREGPLQIDPWSVTLGVDGRRRVTTLSADGRLDELLWEGGSLRRRVLGRAAIPAGERAVGAVFDGDRDLVVVTTRVADGTYKSLGLGFFDVSSGNTTRFYRATLPADPETLPEVTSPPWLDVEVEATGPDLRVCSGSGAPSTSGWTLAGEPARTLAAGRRCVVLVRPVAAPPATVAEAEARRPGPDAFLAEGTLPGIGRALVGVRVVNPLAQPTPQGFPEPAWTPHGALDRGFADGPQESPRRPAQGHIADVAGGVWSLGIQGATPAACADADCVALTWTDAEGAPTSFQVHSPGAGEPHLVPDPAGGVLVVRRDVTAPVVHVATDGAAVVRPWPVAPAGSPGDERWVAARNDDGATRLWRCLVGRREVGPGPGWRHVVMDGIACVDEAGARVADLDCGRGLTCAGVGSDPSIDPALYPTSGPTLDQGVLRACSGRVRFDPQSGACALAPPAPSHDEPETAFYEAFDTSPDGVSFRVRDALEPIRLEGAPAEDPFGQRADLLEWRLERLSDVSPPVVIATGYRDRRESWLGIAEPDVHRLELVAGLDAIALVDTHHADGVRVVARVLRGDRSTFPRCGDGRCSPSAACEEGQCTCPPGTDASCFGPPGSDIAPAPSCAAVGRVGPALIDPDGKTGPFPPVTRQCAEVAGLGLAAVGVDLLPSELGAPPPPDCVTVSPITTLHGAFIVRGRIEGDAVFNGAAIAFDGPELSPAPDHDGLAAWDTTTCDAPGRLVIRLGRHPVTNQDRLEIHDGSTVVGDGDDGFDGAEIEVRRDATGTITVSRDGEIIYARATGRLVPLRLAIRYFGPPAGAAEPLYAWAGTTCLASGNAWSSAPAVCACTPLDCAARGATCGLVDDGCGVLQECGPCPP